MTTQVLRFVELTDKDRKKIQGLRTVAKGEKLEMHVVHSSGRQETISVPFQAAALIGILLEHLGRGEKVAVLVRDQEVSPNDAANILGMSRPTVVHRMEVGDLPFRYVGNTVAPNWRMCLRSRARSTNSKP